MQSDFYKRYLRTDKWAAKKEERFEIDGYRCVMCNRPADRCKNGLVCHHVSYQNLGKENVYEDLVSLCPSCHLKIHAYYNRKRGFVMDDFRKEYFNVWQDAWGFHKKYASMSGTDADWDSVVSESDALVKKYDGQSGYSLMRALVFAVIQELERRDANHVRDS